MTTRFGSWGRTAALWLVVSLFASSLAAAQAPAAAQPVSPPAQAAAFLSTAAFRRLVEGKSIVIITTDGRGYEGFFTVSGNALVSRGAKTVTTIPFDQVARIQKSTFRLRLHSLIGVAAGASIGGVFLLANCNSDCGDGLGFIFTAFGAGIGAGIGAGVGGILNHVNADKDIIYDTNRRSTTLAFAPILSLTRKGVAFTVTWR